MSKQEKTNGLIHRLFRLKSSSHRSLFSQLDSNKQEKEKEFISIIDIYVYSKDK